MPDSPHCRSRPRWSGVTAGLLPLSLATALVLTGCSAGDRPPLDPARGCEAQSSARADDVRPIDVAPPQVSVTASGSGALRVPAVTPRTDTATSAALSTVSTETSVVAGAAQAPTTTVEDVASSLTVRAVCDDPANAEFTFDAVTSPDAALDLGVFDGAIGGVTYRPGLVATSLRLRPPAQAPDPATRAVEQSLLSALTYSIPVPSTAIGVGAQWRIERTVSAAITVTQVIEATLKSWDDTTMTVDVTIDETPTVPVFRIPGSGQTLDLTRFSNTGSGTVVIDLRTYFPSSGAIRMSGARELVGADANRPILQQTSFQLSWGTPQ